MHHIFDKMKVKIEPSVRKSLASRSVIENWPGFETVPSNCCSLRILNKDFTRFLQSSFLLVKLRLRLCCQGAVEKDLHKIKIKLIRLHWVTSTSQTEQKQS